jgi:hypothetical protein
MTEMEEYKKAFRFVKENEQYFASEMFGRPLLSMFLNWKLGKIRKARYKAAYNTLSVKKKKNPDFAEMEKALGEDKCREIDNALRAKGLLIAEKRAEKYVRLSSRLHELSEIVPIEESGEMRPVSSSCVASYSSQGLGDNSYARNALASDLEILKSAGFAAEIVPYEANDSTKWTRQPIEKGKFKKSDGYFLMARLDDWQFDAVRRMSRKTLLEWATECWNRGANPKVLLPSLDDDTFERSLKLKSA